jgi:cytochrome c oxidase cbb3-type subunit 3
LDFSPPLRKGLLAAVVIAVLALAVGYWHQRQREAALVRSNPDSVLADPALVSFAIGLAKPAYARHCAACHGADMHGERSRGAPDLADGVWLYGLGGLIDIETTILYGIRSGHPKAHNITDMPALGRINQLSAAEVKDVVEYVYGLSHRSYDAAAAKRGLVIFNDKGSCYDCHGADASGNVDYGSPDLNGHTWLYGGDRATLYDSVYNGRHGLCPAWIDELDPARIRALAVYLYELSHPAPVQKAHG